jgi:hypothetical protein
VGTLGRVNRRPTCVVRFRWFGTGVDHGESLYLSCPLASIFPPEFKVQLEPPTMTTKFTSPQTMSDSVSPNPSGSNMPMEALIILSSEGRHLQDIRTCHAAGNQAFDDRILAICRELNIKITKECISWDNESVVLRWRYSSQQLVRQSLLWIPQNKDEHLHHRHKHSWIRLRQDYPSYPFKRKRSECACGISSTHDSFNRFETGLNSHSVKSRCVIHVVPYSKKLNG